MPRNRKALLDSLEARPHRAGAGLLSAPDTGPALAAICEAIRHGLQRRGLDPADAAALRRHDAAHPSGPAARPAIAAGVGRDRGADPEAPARFAAKIADMAERYRGGAALDLGQASLAQLFAWCLAQEEDGPEDPVGRDGAGDKGTERTGREIPRQGSPA